jgi:cob(I)alamin adenosyltransferase
MRVPKSDARVDAYGAVDEANACLGAAHAALVAGRDAAAVADIAAALVGIQRDLFAVGAQLSDPSGTVATRLVKAALHDADVARLEEWIDRLEAELPPLTHFVLAGGSEPGAALHLARAVCRRAERRMVGLQPAVEPLLIRYVNRLSDLLFVMARSVNHRLGAPELEW